MKVEVEEILPGKIDPSVVLCAYTSASKIRLIFDGVAKTGSSSVINFTWDHASTKIGFDVESTGRYCE